MRKRHLELTQKIADGMDKTIDRIKEVETVYETKTVLLKGDKKFDENTRLKTMESFAETKKKTVRVKKQVLLQVSEDFHLTIQSI